jgi:RNase P/RNase MRP subunit p29
MCDFHSILGVALGDKFEIIHDPSNSHSGMAGNLVNKPNRKPVIFEAEWNGEGEIPADGSLIRNSGECPERLTKRIRAHYLKL